MSQTLAAPPVQRGSLGQVKSLQDAFDHPQFMARLKQATPKHLSPDRMLAVFVQSIQKTPKLKDCGIMSLLGAFISLATVGLEPNTALGHAYLIPFDKRGKDPVDKKWKVMRTDVQVIFGYQGLLDLTFRSKMTRSIHADVVWPGDEFDFWYGSGGQLKHRPRSTIGSNGQVITRGESEMPEYAYMHANLAEGGESYEVMPIGDILSLRNSTQAYQTAVRALQDAQENNYKTPATYTEAPWVKHFPAMARKTVLRAGSKWLPKSIEMAAAFHLDEQQDKKMVDFGSVIEGKADIFSGLPETDTSSDEDGPADTGGHTGYSQQDDRSAGPGKKQEDRGGPGRSKPAEDRGGPNQQTQQSKPGGPQSSQGGPPKWGGAYIIDAQGEVSSDLIEDLGKYADAMAKFLASAFPGDRQAILEHNEEAIAACVAAGFHPLHEQETASDLTALLPMPAKGGPAAWLREARAALGKLTAEEIPVWIGNNQQTWGAFAGKNKSEAERMVAERCANLGVEWSPNAQEKPWTADAFADEVDACNTTTELNALTHGAQQELNELRRDDFRAHQALEARIIARRTELKGTGS